MSDREPDYPAAPQRWSQPAPHLPSHNVQATMSQMTGQLQTVIDAAERAAEAIRFDAEEQARLHLSDAQRKADRLTAERVGLISDMTDDLIRHASTVRDHSEQMIRALDDAISSVTTKLEQPALTHSFVSDVAPTPGQTALDDSHPILEAPANLVSTAEPSYSPPPAGPTADPFTGRPGLEATPPEPSPAPPPPSSAPVSEDAILHATRLAVAGNDRATIAAALRDQYDVADPEPLVAQVLGE